MPTDRQTATVTDHAALILLVRLLARQAARELLHETAIAAPVPEAAR